MALLLEPRQPLISFFGPSSIILKLLSVKRLSTSSVLNALAGETWRRHMSTVTWFWACGGLLSSARGHQLLGPSFLRDGSARPALQRQPGLPASSSFPSVGLHPATIPPSVGIPPASVTAAPVNAEAFQGAGARVPRTSAPCALKAAPSTSRSRTSSLNVLGCVGSGPGASKRDLDACALVCRRWCRLKRASRRSAKLPAGRPLRANIPSAA